MVNGKNGGTVWKVAAVFLMMIALAAAGLIPHLGTEDIPEEEVPQGGYGEEFIYASGDAFYDDMGSAWQIRSIGFGNACWSNHNGPVYGYCDESSYQELAELGFNTVRFYLNYGMFERDETPYVYNEAAFAWLDQNVEWASNHGIRILFNMHYPQGGYQSAGGGLDLWRNRNDEQGRLAALWGAIAERYADNPAVLGYGLVNEPYLLWQGSAQKTLAQWEDLAQSITDAIRAVDRNHILFLEAVLGAIEPYSRQSVYLLNDNYNLISVRDPADNVAYEIHFYQPTAFTHMQGENTEDWNYPDAGRAVLAGNSLAWVGSTYPSYIDKSQTMEDGSGWKYVETIWVGPSQFGSNLMNLTMGCLNLSEGDSACLDDLQVTAYDEETGRSTVIYSEDFSRDSGWTSFNNSGGQSQYAYVRQDGHNGSGCLMITGRSYYNVLQEGQPDYIAVQEDCQYKVSAWVKVEGNAEAVQVFPQMVFYQSASSGAFTRDYMERLFESYADAARRQGGPLFIGEFGILPDAFAYGGKEWLEDVFSVMEDWEISYSFHLYHGGDFALYPNSSYELPEGPNEVFYEIFQRYVG